MNGRRSEYFVDGVDCSWHRGSELNKAVKQFHDRYTVGPWLYLPNYIREVEVLAIEVDDRANA